MNGDSVSKRFSVKKLISELTSLSDDSLKDLNNRYFKHFKDKYDVVVTYTMLPGGCDNVGLGLSANFGGLLMYVASNNVLGFFKPANRGLLNAQFGILFTSGDLRDRSTTIVIDDQDDWDDWDD